METFIVLGFCFILYEALDFFQSCYSNNNRHQQQHPQFNKNISATNTKVNRRHTTDSIAKILISDDNNHIELSSEFDLASSSSSSHSNHERDDSVEFDSFRELDSEETMLNNQSHQSGVFSICDRVNNFRSQQLIDYQKENKKNSNFNDYDKLIAS